MMLSEDRLYGWGAGYTAMPRVAIDLHVKDQRRTGKIPCLGRQGGAVCRWRSAGISRIFVDDYPWGQALLLSMLSVAILVWIYLMNSTLLREQNEQLARPVEIVVVLNEEEHQETIYSAEEEPMPAVEYKQIERKVEKKLVVDERRQDGMTEAKREKQVKARNIVISPPAVRQRKYSGAESNKIPPPSQRTDTTEVITPEKDKSALALLNSDRLQRKYRNDRQNNEKLEYSQQVATTELYAAARLDETGELTSPRAGQNYGYAENSSLLPAQTPPQKVNQQILFRPQEGAEIPELELRKRARSFDIQSSPSQRSSQGISRASKFPTLQQKIEFPGATLPVTGKSEERYVFEENHRDRVPAPQSVKEELSFHSQKGKENPTLVPPISSTFLSREPRSVEKGSSFLAKAPDFSEIEVRDEINSSELISLKEFRVCKDPEREFHLKTQLAVCLHGPSRIETEGVLYFFKHTESAYTIQIDIYNPRGRNFGDRCEVLELAINSMISRVK